MSEKRAAKILVRQSELAERLGLPAGTTLHRIEIEGDRLEPILALVVSGEDYPRYPNGAVLYRVPIDEIEDGDPTSADAFDPPFQSFALCPRCSAPMTGSHGGCPQCSQAR